MNNAWRTLIVCIPLLSLSVCSMAQEPFGACYRLYLIDKEGSDYCALNERSMQRRERQGIALCESDRAVSPIYLQSIRNEGLRIVTQSRWLNTVVVRAADGKEIPEQVFGRLPFVSRVEQISDAYPDYSVAPQRLVSSYHRSAKFGNSVESSQTAVESFRIPILEVHGESLLESGYCGQGKLIAVLDGGFTNVNNHEALRDKVIGWYDNYAPEDLAGDLLFSCDSHGAQVLSIMATDEQYGVWGSAPSSQYYLIRTEFSDTETPLEEDMWVAGAERADSIGADLINSSLGYHTFDNPRYDHMWDALCQNSTFISQGAAIACQKGILVCSAAGNDRNLPWRRIGFPADVEEVYSIGATDVNLDPSSFTSVGWLEPYVKPDVSCRGTMSWYLSAVSGMPAVGNGTSYASPFLCGLMASLWSAAPSLSPAQLRQIVRESASQHGDPDDLLGYGLPDFSIALERALKMENSSAITCLLEEKKSVEGPCFDLFGRRVSSTGSQLLLRGGKLTIIQR